MHDRSNLSLFLSNFARSFLNPASVAEDNDKQRRSHGKSDQCEFPVKVEHHTNHANQGDDIDQYSEQPLRNETLNGIDIAGNTADQIARTILIVKSKRKFLDVKVDRSSHIVADPLRNTGSEILFEVAGNGIQQRDPQHRQACKLQQDDLVGSPQPV